MTQSTFIIPTVEPASITAGDSVQWLKTFPTYNPVNYTLSYALMPTTGSLITFSASDYGDGVTFYVNVAGTVTNTWQPANNYLAQAYMIDSSGNRLTLYSFPLTINPNFATAQVQNYQSIIKQTLDALNSMILGKASADILRYEIRGRSLEKMTVSELIKWYEFYSDLYDAELRRAANSRGKPNKGRIHARFPSYTGEFPGFIWNNNK